MLITLPFVHTQLPVPLEVSILLIICLDIVSGLTNPRQKWIGIFDVITALIAFSVFEYYTVTIYLTSGANQNLFWINGVLGIDFFFALYFSIKNLLEMYIDGESEEELDENTTVHL